jgi:hypothetical protein
MTNKLDNLHPYMALLTKRSICFVMPQLVKTNTSHSLLLNFFKKMLYDFVAFTSVDQSSTDTCLTIVRARSWARTYK